MKQRVFIHKAVLCVAGLLLLLAPLSLRAQYASFAIVSDSHVGAPGSVYPEFIRNIEEEGTQMIVHTGDAINNPGNLSQWAQFFDITGSDKTLYLAPGNHDINGQKSLEVYVGFFGAPYSSTSHGDTLLVFLNTELPGEEGRIAGEQLAWLSAELAKPFRYKLVFLHESLFPVIHDHGLDRYAQERDNLHLLFVRSGVSLVAAGHDHVYDRSLRNGVTYVIVGRAGGKAWPTKNGSSIRYITAKRTGDFYSFEVRDVNGKARNSFVVKRDAQKGISQEQSGN
jgi:3',5'-cyclic AMP phosphodiesterase CpdA